MPLETVTVAVPSRLSWQVTAVLARLVIFGSVGTVTVMVVGVELPQLSVTVTTTSLAAVITVPSGWSCVMMRLAVAMQLSLDWERTSAVRSGMENSHFVWSMVASLVVITSAEMTGLVVSLILYV